jgi:hypothetical protein
MGLQANRMDADPSHRTNCAEKAQRIGNQRRDLLSCLMQLLKECAEGKSHFKTYRQFKMYNDPSLNMALVQEAQRLNTSGKY